MILYYTDYIFTNSMRNSFQKSCKQEEYDDLVNVGGL